MHTPDDTSICAGTGNLAPGKVAKHSTTSKDAALAVDWNKESCAVVDDYVWWSIEFDDFYNIAHVTITGIALLSLLFTLSLL